MNAFFLAKARLEYEKEDTFSLIYETLCMYNIVPLKGCILKNVMNKMLATNFLPYHCCLSAADDNMEKRNISGYLSVDLTDDKITSVKTSP